MGAFEKRTTCNSAKGMTIESKPAHRVWKSRMMDYRTEWRKTWLKVFITTERKASYGKKCKLEHYVFSTPSSPTPLL